MKVKISHTVEIEDVPRIINDIIKSCQQAMLGESRNLKYYNNDINKLHEEITSVRDSISLIDSQLEDVINMAVGLEGVLRPQVDPGVIHEEVKPDEDEG